MVDRHFRETFINHPCNNICKKCKTKTCLKNPADEMIKCTSCFVNCVNDVCHQNHFKKVCNKIKKCEKCGVFKTFKHNCDLICVIFVKKI